MEYVKALWNKVLRCNCLKDELVLKGNLFEGLLELIRHCMRSCWGLKKSSAVHDLARHVTSLAKLQRGLPSTDTKSSNDKLDKRKKSRGPKRR